MILAGFFLAVLMFCLAAVFAGGSVFLFIDIPSLMITVAPPFFIVAMGGMLKALVNGFKGVLSDSFELSLNERKSAVNVFDLLFKSTVACGVIGMMTGCILMLTNLEDLANIGRGLSLALLSVYWGFMFGFFLYLPIKVKLQNRIKG